MNDRKQTKLEETLVSNGNNNNMPDNDILPASETLLQGSEQQPVALEESSLQEEVARLKDLWMRAVAETENVRRRADRERIEAGKYASVNFARDMLVIADNLNRALENGEVSDDLPDSIKSLISGVQLIEKELQRAFEKQGIRRIEPLGEPFDPNFHQAMFEMETADKPAGIVVQVLQAGYIIHDRLLRPALVAVAKAKEGAFEEKQEKVHND